MEWSTRWEEVKKTMVRGLDFLPTALLASLIHNIMKMTACKYFNGGTKVVDFLFTISTLTRFHAQRLTISALAPTASHQYSAWLTMLQQYQINHNACSSRVSRVLVAFMVWRQYRDLYSLKHNSCFIHIL